MLLYPNHLLSFFDKIITIMCSSDIVDISYRIKIDFNEIVYTLFYSKDFAI